MLRYVDVLIYGLLLGWCISRFGCTLIHDHPGQIVSSDFWFAVGPWPDGTFRHDLGLYEWVYTLCFAIPICKVRCTTS